MNIDEEIKKKHSLSWWKDRLIKEQQETIYLSLICIGILIVVIFVLLIRG